MAKKVLVVGAGIVGASVAWHLAKAGCAIIVVDAGEGGGVATAHSFAWINATWGNPERYFHFRRRSMAGWRRLESEIPGVAVNWCGGMTWDIPAEDFDRFETEHTRWGYGMRRVDNAGAQRIEPGLKTPPDRALFVAEEGMVEPVEAARAILAAVVAAGGKVMTGTRVASFATRSGKVIGATTGDGTLIQADETVIAAGTETQNLLETIGVRLRMIMSPGLIMHSTVASERLLNGLVFAPQCNVRQTREGRLIAGSDFAGADPKGEEERMARELLARVKALVRGSESLDIGFITVGHRPTPADGFPAIGRPDGVEGLYVTVMHSGVTLAPIVGELVAREIAEGFRDPDLAPYHPGRAELV
ncbi:NAD(P)/FAD-dependent oxidoreductase [Mesorhizobium sp. IMUNJ 23232]|uniref:NAD(P)/FAD-dependent oxidoreductase n=1 Tax=Mesorhizobium sp. IMUNJ 23232 TaxID=3376064 RepID=UPI0037A46B7A